MSLTVSFTVTQAADGSNYSVLDTSNYAANGGKSAYTNRTLLIYFSDGSQQSYTPTPFSFADYPDDILTISNQVVDYALRMILSVDSIELATLTTTAISSITSSAAAGGGNITSAGGGSISARGVCWNTTGTPTISDTHTSDGSGTGSFTSALTGLDPATTYYVRAYATNQAGTSYGSQVTFDSAALSVLLETVATSNYNASRGSSLNILYALKITNNTASAITITDVDVHVAGTYVGADTQTPVGGSLLYNTTPVTAGASFVFNFGMAGAPEDFNFSGLSLNLNAGATKYLMMVMDINSGATIGHTFQMNGATDPIVLTIAGSPTQDNEQSNVSPTITIIA